MSAQQFEHDGFNSPNEVEVANRAAARVSTPQHAPGPDICGLAEAHAIELACRQAFDSTFHKCRATMTYDQWRLAFKVGFGAGSRTAREDCLKEWADHMSRMAATGSASHG